MEDRNLLAFWTTMSPMPTARGYLAGATGSDGHIYAIGGENVSFSPVGALNTVEAYNTNTNTWSSRAPLQTGRVFFAAAAGPDGRIYAFGGYDTFVDVLSTAEAYSPFSNTWTVVAPMQTARTQLAGARGSDGRIYAIGGVNEAGNILNTVEAYSPFRNTWTFVAPMHTVRVEETAATGLDGRIYVFGGFGGFDQHGAILNTVECYSPFSNTWTLVAPMPTARRAAAAVLGPNGRLFVLGGRDANDNFLNTVEAYNPFTNTWSTEVSMPTARVYLAAALGYDGRVYAFGGFKSTPTQTGVLLTAVAANEALQAVFGFAVSGAAKSPTDASADLASDPLLVAPSVSPSLEASSLWVGQPTGGHATALHEATDAVFAASADSLSFNLTAPL